MNVGKQGEDLASHFLRRNGYKVLDRGYRTVHGEVDLVARKEQTIVFCEVKTRLNKKFGEPLEAVTAHKQARIRRVAEAYVQASGSPSFTYRFDVVSILLGAGGKPVEFVHIRNAF